MAKLLKLRRGTTAQHASFTGAEGEVTIDTNKDTAVVHDGSTQGGTPLAKEDMSNVSSASIAGRLGTDSIATTKIAGGALPTDVTIQRANIVSSSIKNSEIAADAAISGTKLENSGVTAGQYGSSSAIPIVTVDAQGLVTAASTTAIDSTTIANGSSSVSVANNGAITSNANHDFSAGIDVTGNITSTGTITSQDITIQDQQPRLNFVDNAGSPNNPDYLFQVDGGQFVLHDSTNGQNKLTVESNGVVTIPPNCDFGAGIDVTGNISVSGTVDGRDVAADGTKLDGITTGNVTEISGSASLANGVTAATQAQSDNSTKVSTTAYVRTAISEAQAFPSGTKMIFQQTSAPTGWTKVTSSVDNKALRVVSGTAGSGGTNAFTNTLASRGITANSANATQGGNVSVSVANATQGGNVSVANNTQGGNVSISSVSTSGTVNSHTLSVNEIPSHSHSMGNLFHGYPHHRGSAGGGLAHERLGAANYFSTDNTGGSGGHSHGFSGSSHNHNASFSGSAHSHNASFSGSAHNHNANASFSGSAHNHSISVGNLDMAVQYLDVIIAAKD